MGAVSAVTDFVGDVVDTAVDTVKDAGSFVDDTVRDVVPGGWATVAAVATMNPELIGLEGATAAGTDYLGSMALGDATTGAVGTGATGFGINAGAGTLATDAALAAGTAGAADYLGSTALGDATTGAVGSSVPSIGIDPSATLSGINVPTTPIDVATGPLDALNTDSILNSALKGAGKGALTGGLTSAVMGGDPLQGALMGGVTGGVGGAAGNTAYQLTGSNIAGGVAGGVAGGGTSALLGGRDPLTGALIGGLSGGTTAGINELTGSNLGSTIAPLTGTLISGAVNGTPTSISDLMGGTMSSGTSGLMNTGTSLMSGSSTLGGSSGTSSGLPTYLPASGLAGAPVYTQNAEIIKKLKQLNPDMFRNYPQLETANPRFLQAVFGNPETQTTAQQNVNPLSPLTQATFQANPTGMGTKYAKKGGQQTTNFEDLPAITVTGSSYGREPLDPLSYQAIQELIKSLNSSQASARSQNLIDSGLKMLSPKGILSGGYRSGGLTVNDDGEEHIPEFITGATGHYVKGKGDGQSDDIPARSEEHTSELQSH